jgi:DedD protein
VPPAATNVSPVAPPPADAKRPPVTPEVPADTSKSNAPNVAAEAKPPAASAAEGAKTTSPVSPREGFAVQLAAFADDKGANALAGRLKRAGYTAYTEPLKTSKGTLWRVRVGPYPSREAAALARDRLKAEGQSGIVAAIK